MSNHLIQLSRLKLVWLKDLLATLRALEFEMLEQKLEMAVAHEKDVLAKLEKGE